MSDTDPSWTSDRRSDYLLRTTVLRPLSTDRMVWPSVLCGRESLPEPLPWVTFDEVRGWQEKVLSGGESSCLVAIGVIVPEDQITRVSECLGATDDLEPEEGWSFLGYDVSDAGLLSGLSNCGFLAGVDDVSNLRRTWSPLLNDHGLFDDLVASERFRIFSDRRVSEHAPFFSYGLWLVK